MYTISNFKCEDGDLLTLGLMLMLRMQKELMLARKLPLFLPLLPVLLSFVYGWMKEINGSFLFIFEEKKGKEQKEIYGDLGWEGERKLGDDEKPLR